MSQHPSVGRFYDEHTQDLENGGRTTREEIYTLAAAMLEDGRQLSEDYERLRTVLVEIAKELPCERPCDMTPKEKCVRCGDEPLDTWCAGCIARRALASASKVR